MKTEICGKALAVLAVFLLGCFGTAFAGEAESVLTILQKKGVITAEEYQAATEELKLEEQEKQIQLNTRIVEAIAYNRPEEKEDVWIEKVKITGLLEGEYRWMKFNDIADRNSDSTSDLYIRRLEFGLDAELTDWIRANSVLNSEWIGDNVNQGDELITVDQATITLQNEDFPFYVVAGKRAQPFGVFENHIITDPMTQDAYETKRAGITLGVTGPLGLDLSATLYKGEEQMDHLVGSGLFAVARTGAPGNDVASYIATVSLSPAQNTFTLFGSLLSEPGRGDRSETLNAGLSVGLGGLKLDGEYMKALKREKYNGLNEAFEEGVYSVTASYLVNNDEERDEIGGATFAERLSHILDEPLHFTVRLEGFDDDGFAEKTVSWSAKSRYSVGMRYPFFRDEEKGLAAYVAAEYRNTDYRMDDGLKDSRADSNEEVFVRIGAAF